MDIQYETQTGAKVLKHLTWHCLYLNNQSTELSSTVFCLNPPSPDYLSELMSSNTLQGACAEQISGQLLRPTRGVTFTPLSLWLSSVHLLWGQTHFEKRINKQFQPAESSAGNRKRGLPLCLKSKWGHGDLKITDDNNLTTVQDSTGRDSSQWGHPPRPLGEAFGTKPW